MLVVVVAVALVRPVSFQATLYSLPIPLTVGLATIPGTVSSIQPLSVFCAVGFFYLAAWLRDKWRNAYTASICSGGATFVAIVGLNHLPQLSTWSAALIALAAWIPIGVTAFRRLAANRDEIPRRAVDWRNILSVLPMFALASVALPIAGSLGAMFPFAGLAVSTAIPGRLWTFAHAFALRSIGLIGFSIIFASARIDYGIHAAAALVLSWLCYLTIVGIVTTVSRKTISAPNRRTGDSGTK